MRESRTKDRTRLPADSTELWLEAQKRPARVRGRHRKPPEDTFEAWMKKRVERTLQQKRVAE